MCEDDERPLVSIGMTVYNQEEYVAGAIESILMQQVNFRYEIVISEDCSKRPNHTYKKYFYKAMHRCVKAEAISENVQLYIHLQNNIY